MNFEVCDPISSHSIVLKSYRGRASWQIVGRRSAEDFRGFIEAKDHFDDCNKSLVVSEKGVNHSAHEKGRAVGKLLKWQRWWKFQMEKLLYRQLVIQVKVVCLNGIIVAEAEDVHDLDDDSS